MVYDFKGFVVRQVPYFLFAVAPSHFSLVIARPYNTLLSAF